MPNRFQIKRTTTSGLLPNVSNVANTSYIAAGELAINLTDRKLLSSNGSATFEIGANLASMVVGTGFTLTSGNANFDSGVLFVDGTNNRVGIGNTTPGHALSVTGTTNLGGVVTATANVILGTTTISANGSVGTAGQILTSGGSGNVYWSTGGGGSPGGANTQIQFNDSGSFGGDAGLTYNKTTDALTVAGALTVNGAVTVPNTAALGNTTITGFVNATSSVNAASFTIDTTVVANSTAVYATRLNSKTEGNLNVNNAVTSGAVTVTDTRAAQTTPETLALPLVDFDFKQNTTEGLSDGGTYFGEMTFRPYGTTTDWSGGPSHQLGFTSNNNVYHRSGTNTTWGTWARLYKEGTVLAAGNTTITGFANVTTTATVGTGFTLTSGNANFDSGVLFVDGTNNRVGVGNTTPGHALSVTGTTNLGGAVTGITTLAAGNTTITGFANVTTTATVGTGFTLTSGNANFDSGVLFVDGTNNRVGIGTASPVVRLDVSGGEVRIANDIGSTFGGQFKLVNSASGATNTDKSFRVGPTGTLEIINSAYNAVPFTFTDSGVFQASSDIRAPIFYDSANTSFYLDPGSTSNLNGLTVASTITGSITGNAGTATTLQTARTINGVSFNGSANITITANTTNTLTRGTYLTGDNFNGSAATTWAVDATTTATASKIVARNSSGDDFRRYGFAEYFNMSHGASGATTDTVFYSSGDDYIRKNNATGFRASLNVPTRTGGDASGTWDITANYCRNLTQGFNTNWNTDFSDAPAGGTILRGDTSTGSATGGPGGTWWFQQNMRHGNASNVWGVQVAWGWEDNTNRLRTRNVTSGTYSAWVEYLSTAGHTYSGNLTLTGSIISSASDVRAPIFYDQNNTGYYVDPNGASNIRGLLTISATSLSAGVKFYNDTGARDYRIIQKDNATLAITDETAGAERMSISTGGSVTIPTDVRSPIFYDSDNTAYFLNAASSSTINEISMFGLLTGKTSAATDVNTANDTGSFSARGNTSTVASMSFHRTGAYAINMGLGTDNVFRIGGWSASSNALQMDGSGNLTMLNNVTAYSDARLKTDIVKIENALDKVQQLNGYTYTRTDTGSRQCGVIAQEVMKVLPEVVMGSEETNYSVAYGNMVGLLIEAIKEQQAQIDKLTNLVDKLLTK
jgi:hypothetical protein